MRFDDLHGRAGQPSEFRLFAGAPVRHDLPGTSGADERLVGVFDGVSGFVRNVSTSGRRRSPGVLPFDRSPGSVPVRAFIGSVHPAQQVGVVERQAFATVQPDACRAPLSLPALKGGFFAEILI
jgi:hypothetical protein